MQAAPGRPGHYAVGAAAGVQHLVTLSIVRIDRASGYGYHRARPAQGRAAPQRLLATDRTTIVPPAPVAGPCHPCAVQPVYDAVGGMDGLRRLAAAWHARVPADEVVSHAFGHGSRSDHTERLAAYWAEALGDPPHYSGTYGDETAVVRIHSGNGPHEEMDRRAITCFDAALDDAGLTDERMCRVLHAYFAWATTTTMARYPGSADDVSPGTYRSPGGRGTASSPAARTRGPYRTALRRPEHHGDASVRRALVP